LGKRIKCTGCDKQGLVGEFHREDGAYYCDDCMRHIEEDPADFCSVCGHRDANLKIIQVGDQTVFVTLCQKHMREMNAAKSPQEWLARKAHERRCGFRNL
jgi:hypothetical protein